MVLTICKDFLADCKDFSSWSYRYELSQVDTSELDTINNGRLGCLQENILQNSQVMQGKM